MDSRQFAESEGDPLVGHDIAGRFRITARIGTGGMGTVYAAQQTGLNRPVALKILKKELVWDRDTVQRFHREAKAMSLLTHPNTVRVFDFGETDDELLFLAMELLEGELLTAKLEREGALDVREAVQIIQQILRSLAEAHSKGIIHRDLKPDNIYLARIEGQPTYVVKVLDFGIAKIVHGESHVDQLETQAGTVFGTPRYMSPEQAQGKQLDPRSDLYSVGVLLYQLLTGRPPFVDDDAVVVMAKHIREKPDVPTVAAPDRPIPPSLEKVVLRAMEKDPVKRYRSAAQFDSKLEATLTDVDAETRARAAGKRRSVLATRLGPLPAVPLAIGGAVLAIAIGLSAYLVTSPTEAAVEPPSAGAPAAPRPVAAPPARRLARVRLVTDPPGAQAWRDGQLAGVTPFEIDLPQGGPTPIELRRPGYETTTALVDPASREHVQPLLAAAPAGEPSEGARVGRPRGRPRGGGQARAGGDSRSGGGSGGSSNEPYEQW